MARAILGKRAAKLAKFIEKRVTRQKRKAGLTARDILSLKAIGMAASRVMKEYGIKESDKGEVHKLLQKMAIAETTGPVSEALHYRTRLTKKLQSLGYPSAAKFISDVADASRRIINTKSQRKQGRAQDI